MEQDLEITAESVLQMVRTQTGPPESPRGGRHPEQLGSRIVELFRGRFGKRTTPAFGSVCRMSSWNQPTPSMSKRRRQFRQGAIVLGDLIFTVLGLALYFNLKAIAR